jgi:hypothetical protein
MFGLIHIYTTHVCNDIHTSGKEIVEVGCLNNLDSGTLLAYGHKNAGKNQVISPVISHHWPCLHCSCSPFLTFFRISDKPLQTNSIPAVDAL